MKRGHLAVIVLLWMVGLTITRPARAQIPPPPAPSLGPSDAKPSILNDVGIDQLRGMQVPGDLVFNDEAGNPVRLGSYFGKQPIILTLVYYDCPQLCTMVLNDLLRTINSLPLRLGSDYQIVTISFDPRDTPALAREKKARYIAEYKGPGNADAGWHFLTGTQRQITAVTSSVGFRYAWDAKNKQFAHASGIIVLTDEGRVSKYFYGIDYSPKDLRFALEDASARRIGTLADVVLQYCYHYDPGTGKYGLAIDRALKTGGALTLLALATFITMMIRRDRRQSRRASDGDDATVATQSGAEK